jgi:mono/diheme cytochrome c family protein
MKKLLLYFFGGLVVFMGIVTTVVQLKFRALVAQKYEGPSFNIDAEVVGADVNLGRRIYEVRSNCKDCHGADLTGLKILDALPMGTFYGANITPAKLNSWSNFEIARAIRYGIHKTGRSLRFMPSFDYESLSKSDIASVIKYLRVAVPSEKASVEPNFGPVAKVLTILRKMPVAFPAAVIDFKIGFNEKPAEAADLSFGKYLAGACVGCHGTEFKGGKIPGGDPSWPVAANIRLGAGSQWTEETFKQLLTTGVSPLSKKPIRLPMPTEQLKELNEMEVKALWLFLSSLK